MEVTNECKNQNCRSSYEKTCVCRYCHGMKAENLYVAECYANKGPTMKRIHPRAQGRAYRIEKRMSHITIVLDER